MSRPGEHNINRKTGIPDYMKNWLSTAPYREDVRTDNRGGGYSDYMQRGHSLQLNEILKFYKGEKGLIGLPTGKRYIDKSLRAHRTDYNPSGEEVGSQSYYTSTKRDDFEKSYNREKGKSKFDARGGKRKTVEIGGENLNWLQRNFPRIFLERYKVKSKYDPQGELVKRVTTSRAGGRQVERFPSTSELEAMIAADILKAQNQ